MTSLERIAYFIGRATVAVAWDLWDLGRVRRMTKTRNRT